VTIRLRLASLGLLGLLLSGPALALAPPAHRVVSVTLPASASAPVSGRLLLFVAAAGVARGDAKDGKVDTVDLNPFQPTSVSVAAREVTALAPGASTFIDGDDLVFPAPLSQLPPGDYVMQAVLDVDHSYAYDGRGGGDLVSAAAPFRVGADTALPTLTLATTAPAATPWAVSPRTPPDVAAALPAAKAHTRALDFTSPALSAFWGRPIHMRGWVMLPPGADAGAATRYPTVYFTHGFGGNLNLLTYYASIVYTATAAGTMPPMIWVFLDESSATGTHEFADSVNNGPWGQALTTELIPYLEKTYPMDGKPRGRFLTGHSSGGWATLWLQTRYPTVFGGTWSTSPDPSDFHDFTGTDLYAAGANAFHKPDGSDTPLIRDKGKVMATFRTFAQLERVLGEYGGQLTSFEWVFSPRGADGRPQPMFDRDSGVVDPAVVAYWHEHYDIAYRLKRDWPSIGKDLDGKIHLIVGTADTFYLDGPAHRLKATLDGLHAKSDIRFIDGRTHFDLYTEGDDRFALLKKIAWEMYKLARP
jgi:S-formylglutathione hydrolase FrmB